MLDRTDRTDMIEDPDKGRARASEHKCSSLQRKHEHKKRISLVDI